MPLLLRSRHARVGVTLTLAAVLAMITWVLVWASGAPAQELSATPDEAAHYVTSLMIRGYLTDAAGQPPIEYAQWYYLHYPKVAFGIWPPLFHVALGVWLFVVDPSHVSALAFVALTTTALSLVIFIAARRSLGTPLAVIAAVWFTLLPSVQETTSAILLDMLCGFLAAAAAVTFGRYLDTERARDAVLFALFTAAALMTKNNALALAFLAPVALALSGRWSLLKHGALWAALAIVCLLSLPWYLFTWRQFSYVATMAPTEPPLAMAIRNAGRLVEEPGLAFVPVALIGAWSRLRAPTPGNGLWYSLLALVASFWFFHSFVYPISAARYLLPATAGVILFCVAGLGRVAEAVARWKWSRPMRQLTVVAAAMAVFAATTFHVPIKADRGLDTAADVVLEHQAEPDSTVLVSSDTIGEGAFVSRVASREPSPRRIVLRASKLLATGTWMGFDYAEKYADDTALGAALDRARVIYIAIDDSSQEPHHLRLQSFLARSRHWMPLTTITAVDGPTVRLYGRRHHLPPGRPVFELDVTHALGTTIRP